MHSKKVGIAQTKTKRLLCSEEYHECCLEENNGVEMSEPRSANAQAPCPNHMANHRTTQPTPDTKKRITLYLSGLIIDNRNEPTSKHFIKRHVGESTIRDLAIAGN
jgi:hypothetical protein